MPVLPLRAAAPMPFRALPAIPRRLSGGNGAAVSGADGGIRGGTHGGIRVGAESGIRVGADGGTCVCVNGGTRVCVNGGTQCLRQRWYPCLRQRWYPCGRYPGSGTLGGRYYSPWHKYSTFCESYWLHAAVCDDTIPPSRRQLIGVPLRRRPLRDIPAAGRDAELTLGQWTRPGCHAAVAGVTRGAESVCRCRADTADRSVSVVRGTELKEPLPSTARRGTDNYCFFGTAVPPALATSGLQNCGHIQHLCD